jgi:hypothetical protein
VSVSFVRVRGDEFRYYPPLRHHGTGPWSLREFVVFGFGIAWSVRAS